MITRRTPSVELLGKNANNRPVTIRFDITDLPLNDDEWIAEAEARELPVDADNTRGNIVVGNHNGFDSLIKSFDTLETVLKAAAVIKNLDVLEDEKRDAVLTTVRQRNLSVDDLVNSEIAVLPFENYTDLAYGSNWTKAIDVTTPQGQVILDNIDWKTVTETMLLSDETIIEQANKIYLVTMRLS